MPDGEALWSFVHYIAEVITNGDYQNGWLAALPSGIQQSMYEVGQALAGWLGFA